MYICINDSEYNYSNVISRCVKDHLLDISLNLYEFNFILPGPAELIITIESI